jgi:hypothetical protein
MKFINIDDKQKRILLSALGYMIKDDTELDCSICNSKIKWQKCSIMPPINNSNKSIILCENVLCMSKYIGELEKLGDKNS